MQIGFSAEMSQVCAQAYAESYEIEERLSKTDHERGQDKPLVRNEVSEKNVVYSVREIHFTPPSRIVWFPIPTGAFR